MCAALLVLLTTRRKKEEGAGKGQKKEVPMTAVYLTTCT